MNKVIDIDLNELKARYRYEPESGNWYHARNQGGCKKGTVAGSIEGNGYRKISYKGKKYSASRLAWFYMTGESPPLDRDIDHRNRDPSDNRWANLRIVTRKENNNNKGLRIGGPRKVKDYYIPKIVVPCFEDLSEALKFQAKANAILAPLLKEYGTLAYTSNVIPVPKRKKKVSNRFTLWDNDISFLPGWEENNMRSLLGSRLH